MIGGLLKMKKIFLSMSLVALSIASVSANTFFTGQNQSPQTMRTPTGPSPMAMPQQQLNPWQHHAPAWQQQQQRQPQPQQWMPGQPGQQRTFQQQQPRQQQPAQSEYGFSVSAGLSYQTSSWHFDMNRAGSILEWNNVDWAVVDLGGAYRFNVNGMSMAVDIGLRFGTQIGETSMIDDDITNGGNFHFNLCVAGVDNCPPFLPNGQQNPDHIGSVVQDGMSIGRSSGNSMFGYHIGLSFPGNFQIGNARITPSVGWRHTNFNFTTRNNNGIILTTGLCEPGTRDEIFCDPYIVFWPDDGGSPTLIIDGPFGSPVNGEMEVDGSFFFHQPGTSHDYDVTWAGPFVALGIEYQINHNNIIEGRIEIGFPGYDAVGNQPYRIDWRRNDPLRDRAGIFGAMHIGLGANWLTRVSDNIMLSLGMTYDHFTVSDADTTTHLNSQYWLDWREWGVDNNRQDIIDRVDTLMEDCPNWVCRFDSEVNSWYRSFGLRVGLNARF